MFWGRRFWNLDWKTFSRKKFYSHLQWNGKIPLALKHPSRVLLQPRGMGRGKGWMWEGGSRGRGNVFKKKKKKQAVYSVTCKKFCSILPVDKLRIVTLSLQVDTYKICHSFCLPRSQLDMPFKNTAQWDVILDACKYGHKFDLPVQILQNQIPKFTDISVK